MSTTMRITPSSLVRATLVVAASLVVALVASRATTTLWWFAQSAVFAALAYPLVQRLGRHMPKFVAVLAITGGLALGVAGLGAVAFTELRAEANRFELAVPAAVDRLERVDGIGTIMKDLNVRHQAERFAADVSERVRFQDSDLKGVASKAAGAVSASFIVWILTVMLVFTGPTMIGGVLSLFPASVREQVHGVLQTGYARSAGYMGAMATQAVVVLIAVYSSATLLDLDMPGLLAVVAALLSFVPYVGILCGGLPVALMALLDGPRYAIAVLVAALALQLLQVVLVQRRIDRHTVDLGLFLTLAAAMIGFSFRGPGGLLTAVFLAALIAATISDTGAMQALREAAHSAIGDPSDPDLDPAADVGPATAPGSVV